MTNSSATALDVGTELAQGFYPIVYVRGFAPTPGAREDTFYDTYYGYAETAVDKRNTLQTDAAGKRQYLEPVVFEGQLIRFLKEYGYVDAANSGLRLARSNRVGAQQHPFRSIWISRFYDADVLNMNVRSIEDHAHDLKTLICGRIPAELRAAGVDLGEEDRHYRVILIAHSMGGLVARCLIQNLFAQEAPIGGQPAALRWIHRLVTLGTPHGGIDFGAVPDFLEDLLSSGANVMNSAIFRSERMRAYLQLAPEADLRSLDGKFPEGRCLCVIGSDRQSYGALQQITGSHSDGLVKQDRAYIRGAYWANVHRAHSGRKGIVNSFETYENVRRFLFGDTRVRIWLDGTQLLTEAPEGRVKEFYDFEFSLSVRGTGVFLHQRRQRPCENALRFGRDEIPRRLHLHTGFLDTRLRVTDAPFSHFLLALRVAQHRLQDNLLFDFEYPERTIYSESLEVRVGNGEQGATGVEARWLSDTLNLDHDSWTPLRLGAQGVYSLPLRAAKTIRGRLCFEPRAWPDAEIDRLNREAWSS